MAYVYRHIRLDKNEPFYIGIGAHLKRAYEKTKRNKFWYNVVAKTEYNVEILFYDLTWEEAAKKEKEFIKLYGKRNNKTGPLVNITDGGDGILGFRHSEDTKRKISIKTKEMMKNRSEELTKEYLNKARNSYKLKEYYKSRIGKEGHKHTEETKKNMSILKIGKKQSKNVVDAKSIKIVQLSLNGELIKIWDSARQVQRETLFSQGNISNCCNGKYKQAYGFKWEYHKQ
jgi:hypothetical protein